MIRKGRPYIAPVFLPHAGCPHRCAFCDQRTITQTATIRISPRQINRQIRQFLTHGITDGRPVEIAFYGGNFLGLSSEKINALLDIGMQFVEEGSADSIRFSTRPDTINEGTMEMISHYPVSTIELGAQSMVNSILTRSLRGHTARDTRTAAKRIKSSGYQLGLQIMVGLPGDSESATLETGRQIVGLSPEFVRIYPAVVLEGSELADRYRSGEYCPLSIDDAVERVKKLYQMFSRAGIAVIRMGLQASRDLDEGACVVAGPYHPAFGHLVLSAIFRDTVCAFLNKQNIRPASLNIRVHPRNISRMRGQQNDNIRYLKKKFEITDAIVRPDNTLAENQIIVNNYKLSLNIV